MKNILTTIHGSRLYGCPLPTSDMDIKHVHLASLDEILSKKGVLDDNVQWEEGSSLKPPYVEHNSFPLVKLMRLLTKMDVNALSILFAPREFWLDARPEWEHIHEHRHNLIHHDITPTMKYAKAQAMHYAMRGKRLQSLLDIISYLEKLWGKPGAITSRGCMQPDTFLEFYETFYNHEGVEEFQGGLSLFNTRISAVSVVDQTLLTLRKKQTEFGQRTQEAMTNGEDRKALYHAVRIISEGIELLQTGNITYPRPEADTLMKIRLGEFPNVLEFLDEQHTKLLNMIESPRVPMPLPVVQQRTAMFLGKKIQTDYIMRDSLNFLIDNQPGLPTILGRKVD